MKTLPILTLITAAGVSLLALPATGETRFATLYNFTDGVPTGLTPANGVLYGAFSGDAPTASCGGIFKLQPPDSGGGRWTETVLYSFAQNNDACFPNFGPVVGTGGVLYGLTIQGGVHGFGALYELDPPASSGGVWTESVLFSFGLD